MAKHKLPRPTDAELSIRRVLWKHGPRTVRQVHETLGGERAGDYTTILKLLQIMAEKGLVLRDERERSHVYRPRVSEAETQGQLVQDLLDRAFGGSAQQLVLRALDSRQATPQELAEVRKLLDDRERGAP